MNILASYGWIKEYLKTDLSPEDFAKKTTAAGNGVERIHDLASSLQKMVVGVVKVVKPHPNANKLRIAEVDIGGKVVEIVCGGVNLADGQKVAVALPGSMVRWHGQGDLVEIKETELRGSKSFGMICAAAEIGFEKLPAGDHDIWDLSAITDTKAGTPLAKALGLDDVIFDIEVTSNRPDCKSIVGQALEGGAATGGKFAFRMSPKIKEGKAKLKVSVKDFDLCRKYEAVMIEGVKVGPSPWWVQKKLLLAGHRPINNVVDVTNLVLHELGQPMHAFDADKLEASELVVRRAKKSESMKALDGKDYDLTEKMLVIADAKKPVAIAGVMGGMETGTTAGTTRVILESATFDPVSVRRTSRALNLASDSSLLFEKGLSTEATGFALARAVELILELAGGSVASKVWSDQAAPYKAPAFPFDPAQASQLIGVDIPEKKQLAMLTSLGFKVAKKGKKYSVTVPWWRDHDIETSRDFVEEIARLYGYANVPSKLPEGELPDTTPDAAIVWERRAKDILKASGLTETYAYAFVSEQQLGRYAIPVEAAVKISNPLSSEQEYMRPSLVPTMLTAIEANQAMFPEMSLFELAPVYLPNKKDIPTHALRLVVAVTGKDGYAAFRNAKGTLERLMRELGIKKWRLERDNKDERWHAGRSAAIHAGEHQHVGVIGEISPAVAKAFGIDGRAVLVDLDFESLVPMCSVAKSYRPIPTYPEVKRDLAFVVGERMEYGEIERELKKSSPLLHEVELFDLYRGKGVEAGKKSMAVHLAFRSNEKTLDANEVDAEMKKLGEVITRTFDGILRA
jgi:phenylalanyl-tRNA synthetase beta chain